MYTQSQFLSDQKSPGFMDLYQEIIKQDRLLNSWEYHLEFMSQKLSIICRIQFLVQIALVYVDIWKSTFRHSLSLFVSDSLGGTVCPW